MDTNGKTEYQYAIGTAPYSQTGWDNERTWTSTGTTASVNATGLSLDDGETYYFSVKYRKLLLEQCRCQQRNNGGCHPTGGHNRQA